MAKEEITTNRLKHTDDDKCEWSVSCDVSCVICFSVSNKKLREIFIRESIIFSNESRCLWIFVIFEMTKDSSRVWQTAENKKLPHTGYNS